jgi:hypothetical protein
MKGTSARGSQKIVDRHRNIVKVIIKHSGGRSTRIACNPFPARNVDRSDPVPRDASQKIEGVKSKIDCVCVHIVKIEEKLGP